MLRARVITAFALLFLLLGGLFLLPGAYWAWLTLGVIAVGAWEWGRLAGFASAGRWAYLFATVAWGVAVLVFKPHVDASYAVAAAFWPLVALPWFAFGWKPRQPALLMLTGWVALVPTWFALVAFHAKDPRLLFALLAVVSVADIGAYFSGRAFGKHKLAPSVSPGKTWEGVAGGLAGVACYGLAWKAGGDVLKLAFPGFALLLSMAMVSVVGDLFESWLKRQAGLKDSGRILPGHGGVLDRIDGVMPALALAAAYYFHAFTAI